MANIKLKNLYICENVVIAFNGQLSLINLTSEINSTAFPAVHPKLTILVSISGEIGEYDEKIEIVSLFDNKTIATVTGNAKIQAEGGNNFIANFINTIFPQAGKYWVRVSFNRGENIVTEQSNSNHCIELKKL